MLKTGTYILHADEGSSVYAEVDMENVTIYESDYVDDQETNKKSYTVPTYYLEMLMEELY